MLVSCLFLPVQGMKMALSLFCILSLTFCVFVMFWNSAQLSVSFNIKHINTNFSVRRYSR